MLKISIAFKLNEKAQEYYGTIDFSLKIEYD